MGRLLQIITHSYMYIRNFLPLLLCLFLCTCDRAQEASEETAAAPAPVTEAAPEPAATPATTDAPYTIKDGALMGIKAGEPLADYAAGLRSGVLRTGEADFDVFYIDGAEGTELGYLMASEDGKEIESVTVTSEDVMTEQGISVGMTYAQLQEKLGDFEVHGSEIEGQTHAEKDGYYYLLDAGNWSYEVDPSTLKPDTKILSIGLPW